MANSIFTIGHSTHSLNAFLDLLLQHRIEAIADVRSQPYSRHFPHFSREKFKPALNAFRIRYVFLGRELGARRAEEHCYINGQARYDLIAKQDLFIEGLRRLEKGVQQFRIALLCAEKDPLTCHRAILVCRHLKKMGFQMNHILEDGSIESHEASEKRLMLEEGFNPGQLNMFTDIAENDESLRIAYEKRGDRIAYRKSDGARDEDTHDRIHAEIR